MTVPKSTVTPVLFTLSVLTAHTKGPGAMEPTYRGCLYNSGELRVQVVQNSMYFHSYDSGQMRA